MSLSKLAYGPDALALVTFDGKELLANDAQTEAPKWRLALPEGIVALHFVDSDALPGGSGGGSPWRRSSAGCTLVVVDEAGGVHTVDPMLGQVVAKIAPLGAPFGSAAGQGCFALATKDTIHLWRRGESFEIEARVSAMAFSNDGTTLVYAEEDGRLHFLAVDASKPPKETSRAVVDSGVTCLTQHPSGTWLVGGESGLSSVKDARDRRHDAVSSKVVGLALDGTGARLAVQMSDLRVIVLAWPSLTLEAEVLSPERAVRGLAFGPGDVLGLAFDAGDAVKVDVVTSSTQRTEAHAGREARSFRLSVRGKKEILSEKEAEEVKRMKALLDAPKGGSSNGARIGMSAGISLVLLAMRLVLAGSRGSTYSPPPFDYKLSPAQATTCHRECAEARLASVVTYCAGKPCEPHAKAARDALATGDCGRAKAALAKVTFPEGSKEPMDVLGDASLLVAKDGLSQACSLDLSLSAPAHRTKLVVLDGTTLAETTEAVPSAAGARHGESPGSLWVAPDGTLFVATMEGTSERSFVHVRKPDGTWSVVATRRSPTPARMWGRSSTDMYVLDRDSLAHFDGTKLTELDVPLTTTYALAGMGEDLVVSGSTLDGADASPGGVDRALRFRLGKWVPETTPVGLVPESLWPAGSAGTWGFAFDNVKTRVLFRSPSGQWAERAWPAGAAEDDDPVVWAAASGETFLGTHDGVFRTANRGASWSRAGDPGEVRAMWGRSVNDVYALTPRGLSHYDGKTWSPTSFTGEAQLLGGTAKRVFVIAKD
ncbi:MAG: WD40 repeat domain-containing protein [Polyangiaceae bacterium]